MQVAPGASVSENRDADWGQSVFERDSPRARATLRTFLCDFLVDDARGNVRIRKDIDLSNYRKEAMRAVTNATVQEICVMQPKMTSLDARRPRGGTSIENSRRRGARILLPRGV